MKKIGYIFKYNPSERMGILVYGVWKERSRWYSTTIKKMPIIFSDNELLSEVKTGQLVYFDLDDKTVSNIERASLANFKVDYIKDLIKCKENESEDFFYEDNTFISFECLDNIILPNEDTSSENDSALLEGDFFDDYDFFHAEADFMDFSSVGPIDLGINFDSVKNNEVNKPLPESIKELFDCFGKYKHENRKECTSVYVFDLSLWVDSEVLNKEYYGKKIDELLFLYDIFVLNKRYDRKGNEICVKHENDCISSIWSLLLSKFNESDLKTIVYYAPKLQPALPIDFCKNNAEILTDEYGMPNIDICKSYCVCKISNAINISDYDELKHKLFVYRNCNATHLEGEGTPMCKMGKVCIGNMEKRLEEQFENVIKKNIIVHLSELSEDAAVVDNLMSTTPDEFHNVATFIENFYNLKNDFLGYGVGKKVLDSYEKLPQLYKDALKTSLLNCANESAISATQSEELSPIVLSYHIEVMENWILESTKQQIKKLVNDKFFKLDDLGELHEAYKANYITRKQYCHKYTQITSNFNICQFLKELSDYKMKESPLVIQWYVVSNIIDLLGYEELNSFNYIKVENYYAICNIRGLLTWLATYVQLKNVILTKAEEKICSVLSNRERWSLFEENIVQSPGIDNIRRRLDKAYVQKTANKELFKHACFQDVMLSDVDFIKDTEIKLFIADNLDEIHQDLMQQKVDGFLKLYLWQKHPSAKYDWNLIKSYLHELSSNGQIRILRYLFGMMASGELTLSVDDLYSEFVETTTPACSAICGILFMLKAKKNDMNVSITPSMLEFAIGKEECQRISFLSDIKELFYPCNGYLAISAIKQNIEFQSFNGILTKEVIDDVLYYVVLFYDSPVDLSGNTIDWLSDSKYVDIAKQTLVQNANVEIIGDKYYIQESYEFFVKQFVIAYEIDDRCGLISNKEWMIEQGYFPRNKIYQPLYTNSKRCYDKTEHYVCRCGSFGGSDSQYNIPFFWCKKKMCVRRAHFLLPPSEWENYCFADLLFIAFGQSSELRKYVWLLNSEISQFICDFKHVTNLNESNIFSKPLNEMEERGIWEESSSVYHATFDEENDEDDGDECDGYEDNLSDHCESTYDKYNGSYAQDELGYSDDDIDIIFDGDPDAYWNID